MAYRLIVTHPNGKQTHSSAEPLPDREAVGMSALRVLAAKRIAFGRDGLAFGREVRDAALGENVTHATGHGFRTETF